MTTEKSKHKFALYYSVEHSSDEDVLSTDFYIHTYPKTGTTTDYPLPLLFDSVEDAVAFKQDFDYSKISKQTREHYDFNKHSPEYLGIRVVEETELEWYKNRK